MVICSQPVPLPDASRLLRLSTDIWRSLGVRLREIGFTSARADAIARVGQNLPPGSRGAIRAWHLRRTSDPASYAMRMLGFGDPVTSGEAREALGDLLAPLLDAGLLVEVDGERIVSPFVLGLMADVYILSDDLAHGGETVMGLGGTTAALCRASLPGRAVERALDLGCGAGTGALILARRASRVVGTDISERAILLSRINAAINGITNVEFRVGDLFAPVAGETFDLIMSQPPFVPRPDGAEDATWLHGGRRGDELVLRLLAELAPRLASGGRAVLLIEWSDDGEALDARVRAALASGGDAAGDLSVLVLQSQTTSLDDHAIGYAATLNPRLDARFDAEVLRRRDHLERLGIRGLTLTVTVVQRGASPGYTHLIPVRPIGAVAFTSARIDKMTAARALAATPERLLSAALRVPAGTLLAEEQDGPGAEMPSRIEARFSREALILPCDLTPERLGLLTFVHEASSVRTGLANLAEALEQPLEDVMREQLPTVAAALLAGVLEGV